MKRRDALRKVRTVCERLDEIDPDTFFVRPVKLYLFGSVLTGKPDPNDVDLVLVYREPPVQSEEEALARYADMIFGRPSLFQKTSTHLRRGMKMIRLFPADDAIGRWNQLPLFPDANGLRLVWKPGLDWRAIVDEIEAITHYVEALRLREEFGAGAYWQQMGHYRRYFLSAGEAAHPVPLAEAGLHGRLTEPVSRGKGPWALCLLHHLLGDRFLPALRTFFDRYRDRGATLEDFEATITGIAAVDLEPFFQDWLWGAASSALLAQEIEADALATALAGRYETA